MHRSPNEFWVLFGALGFFLVMLFPLGWKLFGFLFVAAIKMVRWLCIIGIVTALLTSTTTYLKFGWTPLSLMFGDQIYDQALKRGKFAPKAKQIQSQERKNTRVKLAEVAR